MNVWSRKRLVRFKNVNFESKFGADAFGRSIIDECQVQNDVSPGPYIIHKPQVLEANLWAMGGKKFVASEVNRPSSCAPEEGGRSS